MKPDLNFEYTARKERKPPVFHGADNPSWAAKFWKQFWMTITLCFGFAIAAVVILVLMGALKLLGVKTLE